MRLERLKVEREFFESQRPQRISKLIESAKSQTETDEYKMETRLVEFAEKFYPKYCGVKLTREQINAMRMTWKQINIDAKQKIIDEEKKFNFSNLQMEIKEYHRTVPIRERFENIVKGAFNDRTVKDIVVCGNCLENFLTEFEDLDFYFTEKINGGEIFATREETGDVAFLINSENYRNDNCHWCNEHGHEDFPERGGLPEYCITIDPEIKDELPEALRAQKYLSEPIDKDPMKLSWKVKILSNGYGKDSVTEIALNHSYYDEICFSDTGSEQPETYAYINYLNTKLPSVARNKIRIVHSRYGNIYDYYYNKKIQPIPARRDCTGKFKVEPMKQVLTKVYGINPMGFKKEVIGVKDGQRIYDHKIEMSIGINYSEPDRMNGGGVWYMKNRYPLVEKKVEKKDEKGILEALDYVVPVKSGCFFCPYGTQPYWKGLKRDHPELYEKAKAMQDNSTLKQKFIKFKDTDKTDVELSCSCFNGNWDTDEELDTKNNWSF
jgi:hypothetical protein